VIPARASGHLLLLSGRHPGRRQAETPLIPLCKFPEPALLAVDRKEKKITGTALGLHFGGDAEGSDGEFALACYAHSVFQKLEIEPYFGVVTEGVSVL
jgi:hypothetical protein